MSNATDETNPHETNPHVFPSAKKMRTKTRMTRMNVKSTDELKDVLVQINKASSKGLYSCEYELKTVESRKFLESQGYRVTNANPGVLGSSEAANRIFGRTSRYTDAYATANRILFDVTYDDDYNGLKFPMKCKISWKPKWAEQQWSPLGKFPASIEEINSFFKVDPDQKIFFDDVKIK